MVLGYVSNGSRRFHVFVSKKVQEIQNSTHRRQWRYAESEQSLADKVSRGMRADELQNTP